MRIACEHDRNRLADKMNLADSQDWLVVECGPVIGSGDDLADVITGINGKDARHIAGGFGIDRFNSAMRDGAAKDFCMQHAR